MKLGSLLSGLLPGIVKSIGEGAYGEVPKSIYWWLAGKKTIIAVTFAAAYGMAQVALGVFAQCVPGCGSALALAQMTTWVGMMPYIATVLVTIGVFDAAVRLDPPKK